jgi:hypothetical protein
MLFQPGPQCLFLFFSMRLSERVPGPGARATDHSAANSSRSDARQVDDFGFFASAILSLAADRFIVILQLGRFAPSRVLSLSKRREAATAGRWVGNALSRRAVYPTPCAPPGGRTG